MPRPAAQAPPRPGPVRFVFFDLDGTLLQNPSPFSGVFAEVLGGLGLPATPARVQQAALATWPWYEQNVGRHRGDEAALWRRFNTRVCAALGADEALARRGGAAVTERFAELDRPGLYPDALPCLDALRARGLPLGVVTARPDARRLLAPLGVADRFSVVVDAFTARSAKQDPTAFRLAVSLAGVPAQQVVHVGDQLERDVYPARAAGLTALLLDREGRQPRPERWVLRDLHGLLRWLQELPAAGGG